MLGSLHRKIRLDNFNINSRNIGEAEEILRLAKSDLISFGKIFLQDDFMRSETPFFHYEVADAIDNKSIKQLAIILPRGHGKTVLTKAGILKDFSFADPDDFHFYAWVSATHQLSVGNMDYIKYHVEYNELFRYYFGNLIGRKWTEQDIELTNGCKLISRSNVSGIRGGAKRHRRYDLVILDDFEHEANTITSDARAKNSNLVTAVVYPAIEPHTGRLRVNGTPVHYDSFVNNLLINNEKAMKLGNEFAWKVLTYKAIMPDGNALWSSFFPLSKLEEKKRFYRDSDEPVKFYQEYMMQVQSEEDSLWSQKDIQEWDGFYKYDDGQSYLYFQEGTVRKPVNVFIGCDPATDIDTKDADYSVMMAVAVDANNNSYVLEYERHRSIPTIGTKGTEGEFLGKKGVVDYIISLYEKYHAVSATVEDVAMNRSVLQALDTERRRLNKFDIAVIPEKPGGQNKINRVYSGLSGRFSTGSIFLKRNMLDLINEIVTFGPRMAHDDTIETLYYALKNAFPCNWKFSAEQNEYLRPKGRTKTKNWKIL